MSRLFQKKQYQPYVPDFLSLCERNYAQLRQLLPQQQQVGASCLIQVSPLESYQIKLLDLARFTTTVRIEHVGVLLFGWLKPQFEVRLYHDARLAEVTACQQKNRFKAVYDYPNLEMLLPDEKRQINLLLRDWLHLCKEQGYHALPLIGG